MNAVTQVEAGAPDRATLVRPIEPWAADLILTGVNRLDCALTTLRCVIGDFDDDPESDDACDLEALQYLYEVLRDEAANIRGLVGMVLGQKSVGGEP